MNNDLIERLKILRCNAFEVNEAGLICTIPRDDLEEAIAALSPVLPEEVEQFCMELSWFRGCDDWEIDEFLVEINKDREKAVDLIKRLAKESERHQQDIEILRNALYEQSRPESPPVLPEDVQRAADYLKDQAEDCDAMDDFGAHAEELWNCKSIIERLWRENAQKAHLLKAAVSREKEAMKESSAHAKNVKRLQARLDALKEARDE